MTIKDLIDLADIKEKQAFAYTSIYNGKVPNDELQKGIDEYCTSMAISFIASHNLNDEMILKLRRHILSICADKKHSGHRFYEALYKELNNLQKSAETTEPEKGL